MYTEYVILCECVCACVSNVLQNQEAESRRGHECVTTVVINAVQLNLRFGLIYVHLLDECVCVSVCIFLGDAGGGPDRAVGLGELHQRRCCA